MTSAAQALENLLGEDTRYDRKAYLFIREAMHFARQNLPEIQTAYAGDSVGLQAPRHITGQQLCEACRLYALDRYGFLAPMVLGMWGVHSTSDFGEMVYNLIRIEHLKKSETDRREDFDDVYSFDDAFEPQFELSLDRDPLD